MPVAEGDRRASQAGAQCHPEHVGQLQRRRGGALRPGDGRARTVIDSVWYARPMPMPAMPQAATATARASPLHKASDSPAMPSTINVSPADTAIRGDRRVPRRTCAQEPDVQPSVAAVRASPPAVTERPAELMARGT